MSTVWITGGGSGIGRELALSFAKDGWDVVISGRNVERLEEVSALSPGIRFVPCDITKTDQVQATVDDINKMDLAILNAGDYQPGPSSETSIDTHRQIFEVNYFGAVNCLQSVISKMKEGGGQIAVVGSLAGYRGLPNASAYGPSKAALISLCESLRAELIDSSIRIQLISPGFVKSGLTEKNEFEMPFLMEPADAAREIRSGLSGDRFEIAFPGPFVRRMKLLRLLPYKWYFALTRRMV